MDDTKAPPDEVSRREFLKRAVAGGAALGLAGSAVADSPSGAPPKLTLPKRPLGKTGVEVSLLGFGGGSRFLAAPEDVGLEMLERAIAAGITYFDTAQAYGKERASEKRYGQLLPRYRRSIFLATKAQDRTHDGILRSVEESLKALRTDYLDLIQMHAASSEDNPEEWEKPTGALTALRKLRDQKVVRFLGFTGHDEAAVHKKIIETLEFDTVLMALNAAQYKPFAEVALPAAVKKQMGIIAMKTTKGLVGEGKGKASAAELLSWAFDQPISTAIVGMESLEILNQNLEIAGAYKPGKRETSNLTAQLRPHVTAEQLGWALPDYRDA